MFKTVGSHVVFGPKQAENYSLSYVELTGLVV